MTTIQVPRLPAAADLISADSLVAEIKGSKTLIVAGGLAGLAIRGLFAPEDKGSASSAKGAMAFKTACGCGVVVFAGSSAEDELAQAIAVREVVTKLGAGLEGVVSLSCSSLSTTGLEIGQVCSAEKLSKELLAAGLASLQPPEMLEGVAAEALTAALDKATKAVAVGIKVTARASEIASLAVPQAFVEALLTIGKGSAATGDALRCLQSLPLPSAARVKQASSLIGATTERQGIGSMFA